MAALLTVALGIGVNAVVLSLFDRVLFRPLPYAEPDRLVLLQSHLGVPYPGGREVPALPFAVAQSLARETDTFSGIAWANGLDLVPLTPVPGENPLLWLTPVASETLDVLGVQPIIGPGFSAARASAFERPVLLTYETWQHRYGGSGDVLALEWTTSDESQRNVLWRVVGVLPQGFILPSPSVVRARYDAIYAVDSGVDRNIDPAIERSSTLMRVQVAPFARLAPGVSHRTAQARVNALVAARFPHARNTNVRNVTVVPLQSGLATPTRSYVWLAVVGAWVVLGVTCLTLAILLLTWSQSRRQAAGVRLALGASPRQLLTTALVESACLCAAGAVVGWLAYAWARPLFVSVLPAGLQALAAEAADARIIALTGVIALVSAIAAGISPAIRLSRMAPLDVLHLSRDTFGRIDGAPVLLGVQSAFGVILLVGTLAILPGVLRTLLTPPGFDATDLFTIHFPTANDATASDAREQVRRGTSAVEALRKLPGVRDATLFMQDPFGPTQIERDREAGRLPNRGGFAGLVRPVGADFFRTLAVPVLAGRPISQAEIEQQALVAVVNEAGAGALWPGQAIPSVIGRTTATPDGARTVVGVVSDFHVGIDVPARPTLFVPLSAREAYSPAGSAFPHNGYLAALRMEPGRLPDRMLISERLRQQPWMLPQWVGVIGPFLESGGARRDAALEQPRLLALVFVTLGGITLVLTTIAIYGLASFEVRRRREEMTVRLALGATPRALRHRLAVVIATPVGAGALAGLPFSWVQVKLIGLSLPFVNAGDLSIYAAAATIVLAAALVAAWLPGRRLFTMRTAELLRSS